MNHIIHNRKVKNTTIWWPMKTNEIVQFQGKKPEEDLTLTIYKAKIH